MRMAKKIYLTKTDSLASVVGKIVKAKEEEIILYVPRGTEFAASRSNFILLKREAATAGKTLAVESVDDDVLELADTAGLQAVNPFIGRRQKAVSDIVVVGPRMRTVSRAERIKKEKPRRELPKVRLPKVEISRSPRRFLTAAVLVTGLITGLVILVNVLPRAKIELAFEKLNLNFTGAMTAGTDIKENSFTKEQIRLRGVSFLEKKNLTKSYPSSGKKYLEEKASGEVILYNAYSAEPQVLVASTRLVTPDGKIYRIGEKVTLPGAQATGGKITPSSVKVKATADKPGKEYNLDSGVKFRIPGFQGSPKYEGFYAESSRPLIGGFVGEAKTPTEEDVRLAKEDTRKTLEEAIKTQLLFNLPPEVKILNGAYEFTVTEEKVNPVADENGNFTLTTFGEAKLIGFREEELVQVLGRGLATVSGGDFKAESYQIDYGEAKLSPADNSLTAKIQFKSIWTKPFDANQFKKEAAGKKEAELKKLVFSLAGIQSGEARLWPFWVTRVPQNTNRIIVDVK